MSNTALIYQIFYSPETKSKLEPGFTPLDNSKNERPDWREYWPIRQFLLSTPLEEGRYYGFFAPKFSQKADLSAADVLNFIHRHAGDADVVTFSPYADQSLLFWNLFYQGNILQNGLLAISQQVLYSLGLEIDLYTLPNSLENSVLCNYFVAKPAFWEAWLQVNEAIFAIAEDSTHFLSAELNREVPYLNGQVHLKVFLMERIAALLLAAYPNWRISNYPAFKLPLSDALAHLDVSVLKQVDAVKRQLASNPSIERAYQFHQFTHDIGATGTLPSEAPKTTSVEPHPTHDLVSFVICSINEDKLQKITRRIHECISSAHEIIAIRDAKSLCEGYTRGMQQAKGDLLIFCHDDIDFLSDQALLPRLENHLRHYDVVGVAGTKLVVGPFWMSAGPTSWAGMVIHHKPNGPYELTVFDSNTDPIQPTQALDGVFLAMRRAVAEQIQFDAETFDGFHGYDIDFTYRCHLAGLKLGACKDLLLVHESAGNFGDKWREYGRRFIKKFPHLSDKSLDMGVRYSPCAVVVKTEAEVRIASAGLLKGFISPEDLPNSTVAVNNSDYQTWKTRKSLQEIDGQLLAERMHKWAQKPSFNVVVEVHAGEDNLLADTIDALGAQWYPNWHMTIVADFPAFSPEFAEIPQISWIECAAGGHAQAINEALPNLPGTWIGLLEAGCTLEPHALAYVGDTLNLYPSAMLIYCDEDKLMASGETAEPRFKPDFNLELLRGMYYFGPGIFVQRKAFDSTGGLSTGGMAGLYDLSLKLAESQPLGSIIHLPEILLHTPEIGLRTIEPDAEQTAVKAHFERQGIHAEVNDGFLSGTQAIIYPIKNTPLVSIIIPTKNQPGYLIHCIESLLSQTEYQNFELILVDHQTTDPDALDYLNDLLDRPELKNRLHITRNEDLFNYAKLCNEGAAIAKGEYLLFLDNDIEFIQAEWLSRIVGHAQQKGVAAVSPRMSRPDGQLSKLNQAARILGLSGMAGPMSGDACNLVEPGYFGNLQIAQEVSALAGSCLLVKTEYFKQLNGFDATHTPIHEPVLEFCLRLRQQNLKLIWTPWADVVHHHRISLNKASRDTENLRRFESTKQQEREFLLETYLPQLANDPYYHRQLSLNQPYAIEQHAVIDWDTRFHDRLRVLGIPLTSGSGEYRMLSPFRAMQKAGIAQCCQVHPIGHKTQRVINSIELARAAPDTLMVQQAIDDTQISQVKRYRQFNKDIFITYAVDDIMGNLPRKHHLYNYHIREGKSRLRESIGLTDRLIASTEPIAEFCRDMCSDIVVIPNRLEGDRWLEHHSQRRVGKKPRVGWAGAQQHLGDLELIKEVVEATHQEVEWVFMGMCPDFLKPYIAEEHGFVPFDQYPAKLASLNLDLAIAPLEQVIFNEGKSNLRLLEYGIMGWPVVCTDVYPYQTNHAPVKRVQNNPSEWIQAIRERIYDLDSAAKEGDALQQWVKDHYILENHLNEWLTAITPK